MLSDYKKSLTSILEDRISSPFYGSFLFSWMIWNWKIIYLTLFVSQTSIAPYTKIEYIEKQYLNAPHLIIYPFLSAIFLILAMPYFSNLLFRVHLYYENDCRQRKEKYDSQKRLTIEQTAQIRTEMAEQASHYEGILKRSKEELKIEKEQISILTDRIKDLQFFIAQEEERKNGFNILLATYGWKTSSLDVTEKIKTLVQSGNPFIINNTTMGSDPHPNKIKNLLIFYQNKGKFQSLSTREYYQLSCKEGSFLIEETDELIQMKNSRHNDELLKFFNGKWLLIYSGISNGTEEFELYPPNEYRVKQPDNSYKTVFHLIEIQINHTQNIIEYTKKGIGDDTRETKGVLNIITPYLRYEGHEDNGNISVIYSKID